MKNISHYFYMYYYSDTFREEAFSFSVLNVYTVGQGGLTCDAGEWTSSVLYTGDHGRALCIDGARK